MLGKDSITLGSAPDCDVVVQGPGVAPRHARIVRQGQQLTFIDDGQGPSYLQGQPVPPQQPVTVDFRAAIHVGQVAVPLGHPAIVGMLVERTGVSAPPGQLLVGRDRARCSLVLHHPTVSGLHAVVMLDRMMVVDQGSTSGTYVAGQRIAPQQPTPLDPSGFVAFGALPLSVAWLMQLAGGMQPGVGAPAAPPSASPVAATPAAGAPAGASGSETAPRKHRTVIGELSLDNLSSNVVTIGRTAENQIVVPHPQVSSKHAQIVREGQALFLVDLGSANGTFVRGARIAAGTRVPVQNGEKVFIGPMPVLLHIADDRINVVVEDQEERWAGRPLYEVEAWDLSVEVPDRDDKSKNKVLLDHVSFKALPGDMIALMGPSGAGKTTLLLTLNGYLPPTGGQVRVNGQDLYAIYDALRGSIGYVPQDDLVHPELTVFEAVKYSARFRLPPDYSEEEIDARVEQTLRELGLEGVRNLQIGRPEKKTLSGGQRKRVNIALELVTDPVILFLDEPTSGLAADDTTALITLLADLTKRTGKTVIMTIHQPAKDEYEKFNLAFIMGYGGVPTYFGPTASTSYGFFGEWLAKAGKPSAIDNPRDMFDALNQRERVALEELKRQNPNVSRNEARNAAAKAWRAEYFRNENPVFQKMYSGKRAVGTEAAARGVPHRPDVDRLRQLTLLISRYSKIKMRDKAGAAIMFLQAPIIGVMLAIVFGGQRQSIPFWCLGALQELSKRTSETFAGGGDLIRNMLPTTDHSPAMNFVVVSAVWFGTSNSAREIVTERAIYLRERMVNLSLLNYVFSKYIFLALVGAFQCTVLLAVVFFALGFNGGLHAFAIELVTLIAVTLNATALGLLLSSVVASAEAAMALTPIALIPQVVLGGLMVPMTTNPMLKPLMYVMPARWGFQGAIAQERAAIEHDPAWLVDLARPGLTSASDYVQEGKFHCAIAQMASESIPGAWGFTQWNSAFFPTAILGAMTVVMFVVLFVLLRRRDPV